MSVSSSKPQDLTDRVTDRPTTDRPNARPRYLGFGLGLRPQHYQDILNGDPPVDWFEVISENYMVPGGQPIAMLERIRERYPIVMHGVSMSIASTAALDGDYLAGLKRLADRFEPEFVSDHLCWTGVHGVNLHDLLPVPYTREALDHVVERIGRVQDLLGRELAIENVSSYVSFDHSEMSEWDFIAEMTRRTGCWLVLDVNNVFVSAFNHGFDAEAFIKAVPADRVVQFHLAGHERHMTHIIDTHDALVPDEVWDLYRIAVDHCGPVSTIIERDDNIPPLVDMVTELGEARRIAEAMLPTLADAAARSRCACGAGAA